MFELFTRVRVKKLVRATDAYDGWRINERAPRIGDVGFVVEILRAEGVPDHIVVECVADDGHTEWVGELFVDELEPV